LVDKAERPKTPSTLRQQTDNFSMLEGRRSLILHFAATDTFDVTRPLKERKCGKFAETEVGQCGKAMQHRSNK
jgi:hypothetical protein